MVLASIIIEILTENQITHIDLCWAVGTSSKVEGGGGAKIQREREARQAWESQWEGEREERNLQERLAVYEENSN